jgi:hypothetical protein
MSQRTARTTRTARTETCVCCCDCKATPEVKEKDKPSPYINSKIFMFYKITNKRTNEYFYFTEEMIYSPRMGTEQKLLDVLENACKYYQTQPDSRIKTALSKPFSAFEVLLITSYSEEVAKNNVKMMGEADGFNNINCLHCEGKDFIALATNHINADIDFMKSFVKTLVAVPQFTASDVAKLKISELEEMINTLKAIPPTLEVVPETLTPKEQQRERSFWTEYPPAGRP